MGIQKCKKCGTKFEYKDLLNPLWGYPEPLYCRSCGASHHVTLISRFIISVLIMLPIFTNNGNHRLIPNILLRLLLYLIYLIISKALSPFILRYKLKDSNANKE